MRRRLQASTKRSRGADISATANDTSCATTDASQQTARTSNSEPADNSSNRIETRASMNAGSADRARTESIARGASVSSSTRGGGGIRTDMTTGVRTSSSAGGGTCCDTLGSCLETSSCIRGGSTDTNVAATASLDTGSTSSGTLHRGFAGLDLGFVGGGTNGTSVQTGEEAAGHGRGPSGAQ